MDSSRFEPALEYTSIFLIKEFALPSSCGVPVAVTVNVNSSHVWDGSR